MFLKKLLQHLIANIQHFRKEFQSCILPYIPVYSRILFREFFKPFFTSQQVKIQKKAALSSAATFTDEGSSLLFAFSC